MMHDAEVIEMGWPPRPTCGHCGHLPSCTVHGGAVACNNWHNTSCDPGSPNAPRPATPSADTPEAGNG